MRSCAVFPIVAMCCVLGYYAWLDRPSSARARRDAGLRVLVHRSWEASRQTYGRPRIHADLKAQGEQVAPKRVTRLMREERIKGVSRRRKRAVATRRDPGARPAPDLVDRNFHADGPNKLWVADITYVPTWAGWLYVAGVVDAWSRRWWAGRWRRTCAPSWVEQALAMAVRRRPQALLDRTARTKLGGRSSTSWRGFYNRSRRHSVLGYCTPAEFERDLAAA